MYQLEIESDAERKLRKLTRDQQGSAGKEGWRIRVGRLRVLYWIDESAKMVVIYDIDSREQVYKKRS